MALAALGNGGHDAQNVRMPLPLKSMTTQNLLVDRICLTFLVSLASISFFFSEFKHPFCYLPMNYI